MNISAKNDALATAIESDARWTSVVARDPQADGQFYYSVKTTGVYCRPSCAARLARPEHVRFHATCQEAEQAGFRPCNRYRPDQASTVQQHAATIAQACRLIEELEEVSGLERLAHHAGLSMYHFHRLFKATTGLTPK
jgi:AraC family transcriptional regulator of adaptative response/methylated-DNA-[protein]-cysteine methyltransferase